MEEVQTLKQKEAQIRWALHAEKDVRIHWWILRFDVDHSKIYFPAVLEVVRVESILRYPDWNLCIRPDKLGFLLLLFLKKEITKVALLTCKYSTYFCIFCRNRILRFHRLILKRQLRHLRRLSGVHRRQYRRTFFDTNMW